MTSKKHQTKNEQVDLHDNIETPKEAQLTDDAAQAVAYVEEIARLTQENNELKDAALRAMAEADNMKKRKDKEMIDMKKYGLSSLAQELIPILENLYRSTAHMTEEQLNDSTLAQLVEGIKMTQAEFLKLLEKQGVKRVLPESGEAFDHNLHQAISSVATNGAQAPNTIVQAIQAGYVLNDRLLKPAMVVVSQ